jgi:hypothetical protein
MASFNVQADTDAITTFASLSSERVSNLQATMQRLENAITAVVGGLWDGPAAKAAGAAGERCLASLTDARNAMQGTNVDAITSFNNAQIGLEEAGSSGFGKMFLG